MQQQALEWPKEGNARVPYRVFVDPDIYRAELERLFLGPTWQYLALANEYDIFEIGLQADNIQVARRLLLWVPVASNS